MAEEESDDNPMVLPDDETGILGDALDVVTDAITGVSIPKPIKQNAFKAFGRFCSAAIEVPAAYLEGVAAEKRAETQARVKLIEMSATQIASQMEVDPEYARVAVRKFGQKIIKEQVNLDLVSKKAAEKLKSTSFSDDSRDVPEIDDDWLNQFEKEASQKSTEEMQEMFGRILAGEIQRPSSYSIRAVKILGELDKQTAKLFKKFCSCCVALQVPTDKKIIWDARVPSLGGNAASNALVEYGFNFGTLNVLQEYGLIISDYNSWFDYQSCIAMKDNTVLLGFRHQGKEWGFLPTEERQPGTVFKVSGVALTKAGKELFQIIDSEEVPAYTEALFEYFEGQKLKVVSVV